MQNKRIALVVLLLSCLAWQAKAAVNCTETGAGRYPDPADSTCKRYSLCVYINTNNSLISYDYTCPSTSFFNPASKLCTTNYVCNTTTSSNTSSSSVCTTDGFVANPNSTDCRSYIQCVDVNGTFIESVLTCPGNNTFYNPNTTLCDANYTCPAQTTPSCTSAGRIPDTTDPTCQTYFLCILATNGTFISYTYKCPSTSVFSPTSKVCTTNYSCPA